MKNNKPLISTSSSKIATAILGGALVGAAIGILFAPDKGCVTREKIAGRLKGIKDDLNTKVTDIIDEGQQA